MKHYHLLFRAVILVFVCAAIVFGAISGYKYGISFLTGLFGTSSVKENVELDKHNTDDSKDAQSGDNAANKDYHAEQTETSLRKESSDYVMYKCEGYCSRDDLQKIKTQVFVHDALWYMLDALQNDNFITLEHYLNDVKSRLFSLGIETEWHDNTKKHVDFYLFDRADLLFENVMQGLFSYVTSVKHLDSIIFPPKNYTMLTKLSKLIQIKQASVNDLRAKKDLSNKVRFLIKVTDEVISNFECKDGYARPKMIEEANGQER